MKSYAEDMRSKMKTECVWTALFILLSITNIIPAVKRFSSDQIGAGVAYSIVALVMLVFAGICARSAIRYHQNSKASS